MVVNFTKVTMIQAQVNRVMTLRIKLDATMMTLIRKMTVVMMKLRSETNAF